MPRRRGEPRHGSPGGRLDQRDALRQSGRPLPLESTATRSSVPSTVTRPMPLTSHRPVVLRGSHPFFNAREDPAAADTPHRWSAATPFISPWTYLRESAPSSESGRRDPADRDDGQGGEEKRTAPGTAGSMPAMPQAAIVRSLGRTWEPGRGSPGFLCDG